MLRIFLMLGCTLPLVACAHCQLNLLPIEPLAPDQRGIYVGKQGGVEVRFINEKDGEPEAFPEPPMTIANLASGSRCEVDGGIWLRKAIYLSADGKMLMAQEYSGSADQLNFYDTRTCRKTGVLDVSQATWHLDKGAIKVHRQTGPIKTFQLNSFCTPAKGKK